MRRCLIHRPAHSWLGCKTHSACHMRDSVSCHTSCRSLLLLCSLSLRSLLLLCSLSLLQLVVLASTDAPPYPSSNLLVAFAGQSAKMSPSGSLHFVVNGLLAGATYHVAITLECDGRTVRAPAFDIVGATEGATTQSTAIFETYVLFAENSSS